MGQLYERAEIYDLIESEQRTASIRKDWEMFLGERPIKTFLDVSIGTGGMTLPLQELGMELFGSDLSEAMLARCREKAWLSKSLLSCSAVISGICPAGETGSLIA